MGFFSQFILLGVAGWTAYNMADSIRYNDRNMIIGRGAMVVALASMVFAMHVPTYGMMLVLGIVCLAALITAAVVSRRIYDY